MQTKKQSLLESLTNTFLGFGVSYIALLLINALYGLELTLIDSFEIVLIFTIVSIIRNYVIRRFFNSKFIMYFKQY